MSTDQRELANDYYQQGKSAFERGLYRQSVEYFEKSVNLLERGTKLAGEVQIWLVIAYEAAGKNQEAIDLCQTMSKHPDWQTRKEAKRMLYILKAPRLKIRPEWLTQIPDLSGLDESDRNMQGKYMPRAPQSARPRRPKPEPEPLPIDLSQVNTKDNRFIWVALIGIGLTLAALIWYS